MRTVKKVACPPLAFINKNSFTPDSVPINTWRRQGILSVIGKTGFVTWHRPWGRHLLPPSGFGRGYSVRAGDTTKFKSTGLIIKLMKPLEFGFTFRLHWLDGSGSRISKRSSRKKKIKLTLCVLKSCGAFSRRTWGFSHIRARIFKRLWSPGIDSNGWIPPAYVAWRTGTITLVLLSS